MSFRDYAWTVLNDDQHPHYKRFHNVIYLLILVSSTVLIVETFSPEDAPWLGAMTIIDRVILLVFLVEYLGRLWVIRDWLPKSVKVTPWRKVRFYLASRLRFMLSPWGIIDGLALLPLFPLLRSLRVLRALRLLRAFNVFKFRYADPMSTLFAAFRDNSLLFLFSFGYVAFAIVISAVMLFFAEYRTNSSINTLGDTIWWAIVTITTVGFGDITPQTSGGRVIGAFLMFSGMFVIAMFAGVISSTLVDHLLSLRLEQVRMSAIADHIIVAGWNDTVPMLLEQMATEYEHQGMPTVLVFAPTQRPESLASNYIFVHGDFTKEEEYAKVRPEYASTVIVVADDSLGSQTPATRDATTVLTVFTIRRMERRFDVERQHPLHVCCEIQDPENIEHARVAGANDVVASSMLSNSALAHTAINPGVGAPLSELVMATHHNLYTSPLPQLFVGDPLQFRHILDKGQDLLGVLVVGVLREGQLELNPDPRAKVRPDDHLIYIASQRVSAPTALAFDDE